MASVPDAPAAATTTNSGTDVIITWPLPAFDGSSPITAYRIKIKDFEGIFRENTATCDGLGASKTTILNTRTCSVPMTDLINTATFNLTEGTLIVAAVEALNVIGYSPPSAENTVGALI